MEGGEQAGLARNRILIDKVLNRVHEQGYASNDGEWSQQVKVSALALPVRHRGGVLATINIVFMKSVMSVGEAADRYLQPLAAAVAKIEARIEENPTLLAGART